MSGDCLDLGVDVQVITLRDVGGRFSFESCWKQTFLSSTLGDSAPRHVRQKVAGVYSDLLFQV